MPTLDAASLEVTTDKASTTSEVVFMLLSGLAIKSPSITSQDMPFLEISKTKTQILEHGVNQLLSSNLVETALTDILVPKL